MHDATSAWMDRGPATGWLAYSVYSRRDLLCRLEMAPKLYKCSEGPGTECALAVGLAYDEGFRLAL